MCHRGTSARRRCAEVLNEYEQLWLTYHFRHRRSSFLHLPFAQAEGRLRICFNHLPSGTAPEHETPPAQCAANYGDSVNLEAQLQQSPGCRASLLALSGEISALHDSPSLVHFFEWQPCPGRQRHCWPGTSTRLQRLAHQLKDVDFQAFIRHQSCKTSLAQLTMLWLGMKATRMNCRELRERV